ncbi:MAG: hypothetical protein R3B96_05180 [Pirellulaceae bacterium]
MRPICADLTGFQWQWVRDERFHVTATQMIKETVPIGGQSVELPVTLSVEADWTVRWRSTATGCMRSIKS